MANEAGQMRVGGLIGGSAAVTAGLVGWCRPDSVRVDAGDPTSAVVVAACWLAWAGATYLSLAVVGASVPHLPGWLGRLGAPVSALAPRSVRRAVQLVVGVAVATGILAGPAAAGTVAPQPTATWPSLDWPGLGEPTEPTTATIVVHDGDSLWAISGRLLRPHATTRQVAALWPRLYAANRAVIGPDPDLIHPGQRLRPTDQQKRTPR